LMKTVSDMIEQRKAVFEKATTEEDDPSSNSEFKDVLSLFLEDAIKRGENPSQEYIMDVVLNFIIAGRDTTAWAMTATM